MRAPMKHMYVRFGGARLQGKLRGIVYIDVYNNDYSPKSKK